MIASAFSGSSPFQASVGSSPSQALRLLRSSFFKSPPHQRLSTISSSPPFLGLRIFRLSAFSDCRLFKSSPFRASVFSDLRHFKTRPSQKQLFRIALVQSLFFSSPWLQTSAFSGFHLSGFRLFSFQAYIRANLLRSSELAS